MQPSIRKQSTQIYSPIPSGNGGVIVHRCLEQNIFNYHLKTFSPKLTLAPPILSIFKKKEPKCVHTSVELTAYVSMPHQYSVATIHNYYLDHDYLIRCDPYRRMYYKTILRRQFLCGLRHANKIIAVSNTTRDLVLKDLQPNKHIRNKIITILNGVDCEKFTPNKKIDKKDEFNILFSGNPSSRKGWPLVVSIASQLPPNCTILCTTGMRDLQKLPIVKNIKYLPMIPHEMMPNIYQQVNALLLPSYREGLSLAVLEAMACGLPVIGFNISSMPEAIVNKQGGLLVDPNDEELLIKAINMLANNTNQCEDYGQYNRERCLQKFNTLRVIDEYSKAFSEASSFG